MMPVMAYDLLRCDRTAGGGERAISPSGWCDGLEADRERATALVEQSLAMGTALAPVIGYEKAAETREGSLQERAHDSRSRAREERPRRGGVEPAARSAQPDVK